GSDVRLVVAKIEHKSLGPATWSPGGKRIAIEVADDSLCRPPAGVCDVGEIWLANSDGTSVRRLVGHAIAPAWSPDSRRIAYIGSFQAFAETGAVTVGSSNGRLRARQLGPTEYGAWGNWQLTWSPRGDLFGYTTVRRAGEPRGRARVTIVRANGPLRHSVRALRAGVFATWSPTGT